MLNFKQGKWLLYEVEAPKTIRPILTRKAKNEFSKLLGDRFFTAWDTEGILIPKKIKINPKKGVLLDFKKGTGFDYLIVIRAKILKNQVGEMILGQVWTPIESSGEVTLDIYDLNTQEMIYTHTVLGSLRIEETSEDVSFGKSSNTIIRKAFKRIVRRMRRNTL